VQIAIVLWYDFDQKGVILWYDFAFFGEKAPRVSESYVSKNGVKADLLPPAGSSKYYFSFYIYAFFVVVQKIIRYIIKQEQKMTEIEHDQNLMLVYAVEGYSQRHNIPEKDTISLFRKHGINQLLRKNYKALHTQDLDESISFAEDVLAWKQG
jgi:hypothetical protein